MRTRVVLARARSLSLSLALALPFATGCASALSNDAPSGYPSQPSAGAADDARASAGPSQRHDDAHGARLDARADTSDGRAGGGFHSPGFEPKLVVRDVAPREPRRVDFVVCPQCRGR